MKDETINLHNLHELHPADLADRLERLPSDAAREILQRLPPAEGAVILAELDTDKAANLLEGFTGGEIVTWLRLLPPHTNADLLFALPLTRRKEVLAALSPDQSAAVAALLRHLPDSAGGIMDNRFIAVRADKTVEECLAGLRASSQQRTDDVLYIYVTDDAERLVGVVSLRDLVFAPAERRMSEIMKREVQFLRVTNDQE